MKLSTTRRQPLSGRRLRVPTPTASSRLSIRVTSRSGGSVTAVPSVWNILYYDTLLGRFDERTRAITGAPSIRKEC